MKILAILLLGIATRVLVPNDSGNWTMYGKNYAGWRHSELNQIHTGNAAQLRPAWISQTGVSGGHQTTPLVFDGQMFMTAPSNNAYALDALTGRRIWEYRKRPPRGLSLCCGEPNRGFAVIGDTLFKVNVEATLVALDRKTGRPLWETKIDEFKKGYSSTVAPLVVKDKIIVGIAGAEFGTRAFIDAYDSKTGKQVWRFWTVPAPGEPGGDSWGSDSWQRGGGSTWITGTYDQELNLIYWGTGNPGPDMYGGDRPGDNLYTCSVVALDADTGKLRWHFQFTPHDVHDWDSISDPVLIDMRVKGQPVKALVMANRNGFFYALNRTDGKFLFAKPYTTVTWAKGIGADGRPILVPGQDPTEEGNKSCPGLGGGHNWQATTYSPQTGLYYFGSSDGCQIYYNTKQGYIEAAWYQGSTAIGIPNEPTTGSIIALDPSTGDIKWRFEMITPPTAGLLSTAGGLVFGGDAQGYVFALDARTGKVLWRFQTGGAVVAPPITYLLEGKQYIAVSAGSAMLTFALP
jgi:alcohol dehydrogenase (cytochrome c)